MKHYIGIPIPYRRQKRPYVLQNIFNSITTSITITLYNNPVARFILKSNDDGNYNLY